MQALRRILPFLSILAAAALLYDGWVFYARWQSRREAQQASRDAEIERDRQTIDLLGGADFRIISFYAVPRAIRRGQQARLCFGVYGATRVRILPQLGDVHPAISDCLEVAPRADTEYTLTAEDAKGHTVRQKVAVKVAP